MTIMQNNHYSASFIILSMENNKEKTMGLTVYRERLRDRINIAQHRCQPSLTAPCTTHSSPLCVTKENISPGRDTPQVRTTVNWIKYNILVSIYDNWLRLEPFIRYWLSKRYEVGGQEAHSLCSFMKKSKKDPAQHPQKKKGEISDILQQMRLRREALLKGLQPSQSDIEYLCLAQRLAKQLLSTLPLENSKWSKIRIQKHNRLLKEMMNNFNEDQFKMNSDAIMHSIKERIFFIEEIQKKFIDVSSYQKNHLKKKLELMKLPFKKVFDKNRENHVEPETLFQNLWQQIESEWSLLLTKKPELRHNNQKVKNKQRYAILKKSESGGLVLKYQLKHGDYYNQSYIPSKYLQSKSGKLKKNKTKNGINSCEQTTTASRLAEMTKETVEDFANQKTLSKISDEHAFEKQQQEVNAGMAQDFMRRQQKSKPNHRQQTSPFFKKTPTNIDSSYSHYRPSILYVDNRSIKDTEVSVFKSKQSISRDRTSLFARRQSRHRPSGQQYLKKDHMSRFHSHQKLITLKNIVGAGRYTKLKENSKKHSQMASLTKMSEKLSRMHRKEYRREPTEYRRGFLHKKGPQRKEISMQEEISIQNDNFVHLNREYFLSYFNRILAGGHLDQQRYQSLKEKVKQLVKKNEAQTLQQTRAYVSKLVQKSAQNQFQCLLGEGRQQMLINLCGVISKDQRIGAKIREQMKIFMNYSMEECCSEDSTCNERFVYNSTELRKMNQELKRILCFREEGQSISFGKRLIKVSDTLEQCSI